MSLAFKAEDTSMRTPKDKIRRKKKTTQETIATTCTCMFPRKFYRREILFMTDDVQIYE